MVRVGGSYSVIHGLYAWRAVRSVYCIASKIKKFRDESMSLKIRLHSNFSDFVYYIDK